MAITTARIKKAGKRYEIMVDLDEALKFRKGLTPNFEMQEEFIFHDTKKGEKAADSDLRTAFGTTDVNEIAKMIIRSGEVQTTQEHRDAEQEKKFKQIVDFLATNAIDPKTGNPHTPDRIKMALEQAHVNIRNVPVENQIAEILEKVKTVIPIKLEVKKIKITIPAVHTGKAYGVVSQYKDEEDWKDDGSLAVVVSVPSGLIMDFYDKLNSVTHGSALTEELK